MDLEVTSVSKRVQPLSDTPAAIYVITSQEILRSGSTSIPEILRLAPGVQVARLSRSNWAVSIRGMNSVYSRNLQVLIDNRSLYSPFYGGIYWDSMMPVLEDIDRIEVIRGPGASVWGANAVNGVINIITKGAEITQGVLTTAIVGNEEYVLNARYGGKTSNTYYRGYVTRRSINDGTNKSTGNSANDDLKGYQIGGRTDWINGSSRVTLQADFSESVASFEHNFSDNIKALNGPIDDVHNNNAYSVSSRWIQPVGEDQLQLQLSHSHAKRHVASIEFTVDDTNIDLQYNHHPTNNHRITWGINHRIFQDNIKGGWIYSLSDESRTWQRSSVFFQDELRLKDTLQLIAGVKIENIEHVGVVWQPTLRLNFRASPQHSYWASASHAVRAPTRHETHQLFNNEIPSSAATILRNQLDLPPNTLIIGKIAGDTSINEETLMAYELGWRWQPTDNLFLDSSVFYFEYDGLRITKIDSFTSQSNYFLVNLSSLNIARGYSSGIEIALDYKPTANWHLKSHYQHYQLRINNADDTFGEITFNEGLTPEHQISLRSYLTLNNNTNLDIDLVYVDDITSTPNAPDAYTDINVRIAWQATTELNIALVAQNLLNAQRFEHEEILIGSKATEIDRSLYLRVEWRE